MIKKLACILVAAVLLFSCQGQEEKAADPKAAAKPDVTIRIVCEPGLTDLLSNLLESFKAKHPVTAEKRSLAFELLPEEALTAAQGLANGKLKVDAWLSPLSSLVESTNNSIRGLGAKLENCRQVFATPMVIAVRKEASGSLNTKNRFLASDSLFTGDELPLPDAPKLERLRLTYAAPIFNSSGIGALLQLAHSAAISAGRGELDSAALQDTSFEKKFKEYLGQSFDSKSSLEQILTDWHTRGIAPEALLVPEQLVLEYAARLKPAMEVAAFYPDAGAVWLDYTFCQSAADWVTPDRRAVLELLTKFLKEPASREVLKKAGFQEEVPGTGLAVPEKSAETKVTARALPPVSGALITDMIAMWKTAAGASELVLILDSTAAVPPKTLAVAKSLLRQFVEQLPPGTPLTLLDFSVTARVWLEATQDRSQFFDLLNGLKLGGLTPVQDVLGVAYQDYVSRSVKPHKTNVVLITVADPRTLETPNFLSPQSLARAFSGNWNLMAYQVDIPAGDNEKLQSALQPFHGVIRKGGINQLDDFLKYAAEQF